MIVVIGSSGQVGSALMEALPDAVPLTRDHLDLSEPDRASQALEDLSPSAIVNAAAYTAVDRAEDDEATAATVNGLAVGELARTAARIGARFVSYSTDYVFDGLASEPYLESSATSPIGAYGRSKLIGEWLAVANHPDCLIIRTSWVISGSHDNFVTAILRRARDGHVRVVRDQLGCPTVAADLAVATVDALERGLTGVAHITNQGEASWFELARAAVEVADMDPAVVEPCTTEEFPTRAVRPAYSVLGSGRSDLPAMPHWRDSLPLVVERQLERLT